MHKKIVERIVSLVFLITLTLLTVYFIRRIPIFMKAVAVGIVVLAFYWFYTAWGFHQKKLNK
ncbi:MAG: hypothetical protein WC994_04845 [Brumimicrobium sp.]